MKQELKKPIFFILSLCFCGKKERTTDLKHNQQPEFSLLPNLKNLITGKGMSLFCDNALFQPLLSLNIGNMHYSNNESNKLLTTLVS